MPRFDPNDARHTGIFNAAAITGADVAELDHPAGDYGSNDEDYTQAEHDAANGIAVSRDESGLGHASADEVQAYYSNSHPTNIQILKND